MEVAAISLTWAAITLCVAGFSLAVTLAYKDEKRRRAQMAQFCTSHPAACRVIVNKTR